MSIPEKGIAYPNQKIIRFIPPTERKQVKLMRKLIPVVVLAIATWWAGPAGATSANVNQNFNIPVHASLDADWNCSNTGPTINISGTLAYGDTAVRFVFQNNAKGTHKYITDIVDAPFGVTITDGTLTIPKQPAIHFDNGSYWGQGVGGNPYISFQFTDDNGAVLGAPILLGRCVQGTSYKHLDQVLSIPANANLNVSALECSSVKSNLEFGGYGSHIGFSGLLYLDNNINKVVHRAISTADFGVTLDHAEVVPKGGNAGGAGGNPWISMQVLSSGNVVGNVALGRCHDLLS
jgi:hypothetical protein